MQGWVFCNVCHGKPGLSKEEKIEHEQYHVRRTAADCLLCQKDRAVVFTCEMLYVQMNGQVVDKILFEKIASVAQLTEEQVRFHFMHLV